MKNRDNGWRVALVTGGGTGIGRGIALALAQSGVSVAVVGRRQERLNATVAELHQFDVEALALAGDLTDPLTRERFVEQTQNQLGPIDTLINNAAIFAGGALLRHSSASITAAVTTNLTAPIDLTRLALPDLIAQQGRIVLLGSTTSVVPLPYFSLYAATKSGLHLFGETLRHELTPLGIHVLTAYPPTTATAMTAPMRARMGKRTEHWPLHQATPEQVGARIVDALATGKWHCSWWSGEHLLRLCYQHAPRFTWRLLYRARQTFQQMTSDNEDA